MDIGYRGVSENPGILLSSKDEESLSERDFWLKFRKKWADETQSTGTVPSKLNLNSYGRWTESLQFWLCRILRGLDSETAQEGLIELST